MAILLLVSTMLFVFSLRGDETPAIIQSLIRDVLSPFQWTANRTAGGLGNLWGGYIHLVGVSEENERLSARVKELQGEVNRLKEAEMKLWRLRKLMGFSAEKHMEAITANVVSREADNWSRMMILDRGLKDGVGKDMAVITSEGLMGRVVQATGNRAKILLITDWRSSVDALIQRTRERGIVAGKSSQVMEMKYIPLNADVRIGDTVVSSGLGGLFHKGLIVGTVVKIAKQRNGLFQKAILIPSVNAIEVEEALVVLPYSE